VSRAVGGLALALGLAATGCRNASSDDVALASDLRTLCERISARNVSAFSQPLFQTDVMRALTVRVDQGDEAARCELSRRMRRHARAVCATTARGLARSCR
jgi:hypothetical protein